MPVSRKTAEAQADQMNKPYWRSECGRAIVYVGDCKEVMARMEPKQFHAVVTDPPYGLEFMGKDWDAPWKKCGHVGVADEGTDKSHPFRDGSARIVYGRSHPERDGSCPCLRWPHRRARSSSTARPTPSP